jgi:hypothetical protein
VLISRIISRRDNVAAGCVTTRAFVRSFPLRIRNTITKVPECKRGIGRRERERERERAWSISLYRTLSRTVRAGSRANGCTRFTLPLHAKTLPRLVSSASAYLARRYAIIPMSPRVMTQERRRRSEEEESSDREASDRRERSSGDGEPARQCSPLPSLLSLVPPPANPSAIPKGLLSESASALSLYSR